MTTTLSAPSTWLVKWFLLHIKKTRTGNFVHKMAIVPSAEVTPFITAALFLMLLFISLSYKLTTRTVLLGVCLRLSVKAVGLTGMVANTVTEGLLNAFVTSFLKRSLSNSMRPISSSTKMPSKFGCNKHQLHENLVWRKVWVDQMDRSLLKLTQYR